MKLKYLLMAVAGLGLFSSCESDEPSVAIAEYKKPTEFVLNTPQFANGVYDLVNAETVNLTFSQPDYGYAAACDYTIEVAKSEAFAEGEVGTVSTVFHVCDVQIDANEFAVAVCTAFGWETQEEIDAALATTGGTVPVYVRVKSKLTNTVVADSEIASNVITLNVIPYFALLPVVMPENVFMIGSFCGGDWAKAAKMAKVFNTDNMFWCIRYVDTAANGGWFKFNTNNSWDGNQVGFDDAVHTYNSRVDGLTVSGADDGSGGMNIVVDKAGWYIFGVTIAIDGRDYVYTVDVMPAEIYIYGDCAGGVWANDPAWMFTVPETADGVFTSPALAGSGEVRMCINPNPQWGGDWWAHEFTLKGGTEIYYRDKDMPNNWAETYGDEYSLKGAPGNVITLDFNNGTGEIK